MTCYVALEFDDVCWRVRQDAADLLFDAGGLRLSSWLKSGQATVVKQGPHRVVYRVQLEGRSVYVKHYRVADTRAMLSQWAQTSKGRREWEQVEQVTGCAIPTVVPLALGEQRRAGLVLENYLVTEGIDDAEPLDIFVNTVLPRLDVSCRSRLRRQLAERLAELTARLHEASILHPDLHAGNVLVRLNPAEACGESSPHTPCAVTGTRSVPATLPRQWGDAWHKDKLSVASLELFLIDLHTARSSGRLGWPPSSRNLVTFGMFFLDAAHRTDRLRFLRRYLKLRPDLGIHWRAVAGGLDQQLLRAALHHWRKLDWRCTSNNRRFLYRNIGSAHGYAVTDLGEAALLALLRDPDAPLRSRHGECLKESASSTVVRLTIPLAGRPTPVIYKRFNCAKSLDSVRAMLHHSPALRAWRTGHGLLNRRIPTPRPLAMIERTRGPFVRETYLITEAVPDSLSLKEYLNQVVAAQPRRTQRRLVRYLVVQLARLLRKMHDRNISHRDLKGANFLVAPAHGTDDHPQVLLIDLAGVQIWRLLPAFRRMQNLARLLVSLQTSSLITRSDYLRFLRAYQPDGLRRRAAWKTLWNGLRVRAAKKIVQNHKRGRPVT